MPQIHYGTICRNLCLIVDCVWDTLTPKQRQEAREIVATKCVEPYFRIVLQTPGIGLYHLRSRNQGNNALSAAVIGSVLVGDAVPDNRIWFASLLQTYHWILTDDVGWMGQNLESDIGGYWSASRCTTCTRPPPCCADVRFQVLSHPAHVVRRGAQWYVCNRLANQMRLSGTASPTSTLPITAADRALLPWLRQQN